MFGTPKAEKVFESPPRPTHTPGIPKTEHTDGEEEEEVFGIDTEKRHAWVSTHEVLLPSAICVQRLGNVKFCN